MTRNRADLRKIELRLSYCGSAYFGWQVQPSVNTVQRELQNVLTAVLGHPVKTKGASRTDSGVHAHDQHVTFKTHNPIPIDALKRAVGQHLPPDIQVISARQCPLDFSVRYHARGKHYAYLIFNDPQKLSPFIAHLGWQIDRHLDTDAMHEAALCLLGRKDFRSFQSCRDFRDGSETEIFCASVTRHAELVQIDIIGVHFLYHMVRNIVGSLFKVGVGDWDVEEFGQRFEVKDRRAMGMTAPGHGLHLMRIYYEPPPNHPGPSAQRFVQGLLNWFSP